MIICHCWVKNKIPQSYFIPQSLRERESEASSCQGWNYWKIPVDYVILCLYIPFGLLWGNGRILRSEIHSGQRVNSALIHQEMLKEMRHLTTLLKILQLRYISVISLQFYCYIFIALIWLQVTASSKGIWKKKETAEWVVSNPLVGGWWSGNHGKYS